MDIKLIASQGQHMYQVGAHKYHSVTTIITNTVGVGWEAEQWYLERGTAVHACASLIARGRKFKYDERISGYVDAINRFYKEIKPEVMFSELPVASVIHQFAGTIDLVCKISGVKYIIDFKSNLDLERLKLQLAGYSIAYAETKREMINNGIGVAISNNGKYSMTKKIDLRIARNEFLVLNSASKIMRRFYGE